MTSPADGYLLPAPGEDDPDAAAFWAWCAAGELRVQQCSDCGARRFPPRPMCPECRSFDHAWTALSGRGTVWSFVAPHPPLLAVYAEQAPYNVMVVATDDDPSIRFVGNLVATADGRLDDIEPGSITIGEPVELVFRPVADGIALPCWRRS